MQNDTPFTPPQPITPPNDPLVAPALSPSPTVPSSSPSLTDVGSPAPQPVVQASTSPVQQPVMQQPNMVQPQYIVMQHSLKGIGGWLIFWLIIFGFSSISYTYNFFEALSMPGGVASAVKITSLVFTPILAISLIATVVFIAMQRKLGRLLAFVTLGLSAFYITTTLIVDYVTGSNSSSSYGAYNTSSSYDAPVSLPLLAGVIMTTILVHGLIALYFIISKRVKETLVH